MRKWRFFFVHTWSRFTLVPCVIFVTLGHKRNKDSQAMSTTNQGRSEDLRGTRLSRASFSVKKDTIAENIVRELDRRRQHKRTGSSRAPRVLESPISALNGTFHEGGMG